MKHRYQLIINHGSTTRTPYAYSFGGTKGILFHLRKNCALIEFMQNAVHSANSIRTYGDHLCSDAIKKAMLIHLILYSKPLIIKSVQLDVDGEISDVTTSANNTIVFSMITGPLDSPMPQTFRTASVVNSLLNTVKSSYDGRHNALMALLLGKANPYRSEKSMYLWMAVNGFYGFLTQKANENAIDRKKRIKDEWQEQDLMCFVLGIGKASMSNTPREERTKIMQEAMSLLRKINIAPNVLYDCLMAGQESQITDELKKLLAEYKITMEPFSFFCIWLPYQIRCKFFHSNTAMPLFSYADEPMMKVLYYTNYFVERLVEENLPMWLGEKTISEEQRERIKDAYKRFLG